MFYNNELIAAAQVMHQIFFKISLISSFSSVFANTKWKGGHDEDNSKQSSPNCVWQSHMVTPPKDWEELKGRDFPMLFYGVKGQQMREGESPSYFNPGTYPDICRGYPSPI